MPTTTSHSLGLPVFSLAFVDGPAASDADDVSPRPLRLVLGGGGGNSKTGVPNKLLLYSLDPATRDMAEVDAFVLPKDEDAPMSLAAHPDRQTLVAGINTDVDAIKRGENQNLRTFAVAESKLQLRSARNALASSDPEHYQKVAAFSRDGKLLALGNSNGHLVLLSFPDMDDVFAPFDLSDEVYDVDFNDDGSLVLAASSKRLCVFSTRSSSSSASPELLQTIEKPVLKKGLACSFRAARFGRHANAGRLYTIVNAKGAGASGKRSFISLWDARPPDGGDWKLVKTRTASQKPVTAFDVSEDGRFVALGSSDLSVTVLDATSLKPLLSVLQAHDFPPTAVRFSPAADVVVSASADNTVRVIPVKADLPEHRTALQTFIIALLVLVLAVALQLALADRVQISRALEHLHF